ncbi:hypothetical protein GCT13_34385 [Paraburkholderia sp. CNPSo 3157]|uniref:Transposase DDE domain-containing protein n=1 Tax=Paraburkholderia franconis TaxID=2654983 RepID=A0A7X1NI22_9BURK|nr:hypothetical protein [Paraburkholderia franconis]
MCPIRKTARSIHESAPDETRRIANRVDRLRLRGQTGAHDEFLLAATAQNLRRMAKWLAPPRTGN